MSGRREAASHGAREFLPDARRVEYALKASRGANELAMLIIDQMSDNEKFVVCELAHRITSLTSLCIAALGDELETHESLDDQHRELYNETLAASNARLPR